MKNIVLSILVFTSIKMTAQIDLNIDDVLIIGEDKSVDPVPGAIQWDGINFSVFNGLLWEHLTKFKFSNRIYDSDSNSYLTVRIGDQEWMAENLRASKYQNGDSIPYLPTCSEWSGTQEGGWCWYATDSIHDRAQGKLYNWFAVDDSRQICPLGWHVPNNSEWLILINNLGGVLVAGGAMKAIGNLYWLQQNVGGTNSSGFSGIPGGSRKGSNCSFTNIANHLKIWSREEDLETSAWFYLFEDSNSKAEADFITKTYGFSVRCLKDP